MLDLNNFRNIPFRKNTHCLVCDTDLESAVINLPAFPLTEIYIQHKVTEKIGFVDQEFHLCRNCGHGQISNIIDPEFLYGVSYATRTSVSPSAIYAIDIFLEFIKNVLKGRHIKTILEIGCNDLYTLKRLRGSADKLFGIDPILKGKENLLKDKKIEIFGDLFENINLKDIGCCPDVVLSSHTLEHVNNPKKLIQKLMDSTNSKTLFFFQFPGLEMLVKENRFDHIHHQHISYFSLKSVVYMLDSLGAELIDFKINPYHWGTSMVVFRKKNKNNISCLHKFNRSIFSADATAIKKQYSFFKRCMAITKVYLKLFTDEKIYGYGAGLMLPVLDYHLNGISELKYIFDDDQKKDGLFYLNVPIKIRKLKNLSDIEDTVILLTAINSMQTVRAITMKLISANVRRLILPLNLI